MLGSCLLTKPRDGVCVDLGGGVEVWFGHFQSLRLGWQPFLNVDASQRAFVMSGKVHEIMAKMFRSRPGEPLRGQRDYDDFSRKIATLKVRFQRFFYFLNRFNKLCVIQQVSYPRKAYTATVGCNGIKGPANVEKFVDANGRTVTVQQYFEEMSKKKLQYPNLPCVWVGSKDKKNLVPMEVFFSQNIFTF